MRKIILFILVVSSVSLNAQYNQGIGVRGGERGFGLTYNYFFGPKPFFTLDVIGNMTQEIEGGIVMGSFNMRQEIHSSTLNTTRLSWSYGGGIHAGFFRDPDNVTNESSIVVGPDFRLATEFQFKLPVVIGVDFTGYYNLMPALKSDNPEGWLDDYFDFGIYLKYVID